MIAGCERPFFANWRKSWFSFSREYAQLCAPLVFCYIATVSGISNVLLRSFASVRATNPHPFYPSHVLLAYLHLLLCSWDNGLLSLCDCYLCFRRLFRVFFSFLFWIKTRDKHIVDAKIAILWGRRFLVYNSSFFIFFSLSHAPTSVTFFSQFQIPYRILRIRCKNNRW